MDKKALQLASRFSLPPNSLGYCGKNTAPAKLISCALDGNCNEVTAELEKFIVLNPYLNTLAGITGQNKFSYPVIEAYCLGNNELNKAKPAHYQLLLNHFSKQGVPEWLTKELANKTPRKFIPFHLFQVLHVGVGRASGSVPYNIKTINNCMVRWGKVTSLTKKSLTVTLNSLKSENIHYLLHLVSASFPYRQDLLPGIKINATVAVHWGQVIKILTPKEIANLDYWTRQILSSL